ncbi:MAG: DNA mismatch repair protein MutS, partial [Bacteroidota bacterium]|nr:DNA mismatch repair protein MutS [Bacteroidota bacterium]
MQTPLMTQYYSVKKEYPDTVLLFRMGDFFETFEEDAKIASKVLGITLTKRANGAAGDVPLAGFPHHAIETYLPKLVKAGYRVAVCEQVENPKFAKGIVKREVIEVVTPGVAFSDKLLDHKKNNYLLAVYYREDLCGLSFCDISTGEFYVFEVPAKQLKQQIESIAPAEILIQKKYKDQVTEIVNKLNSTIRVTKMDDWIFNFEYAKELLLMHFKTINLKGYGIESLVAGIISAGAALNYLQETQKANLSHLNKISIYNPSDYMALDFSTKRNLEITFSMSDGGRDGSLISILDKTETPMGGRLLKKWIAAPLTKLEMILKRQESVEEFVNKKSLREDLIKEISEVGDLERLITKVCTGRANPRDVINIKTSLKKIPVLKDILLQTTGKTIKGLSDNLQILNDIVEKIDSSIVDYPPLSLTEGGVIKNGFSIELDELRNISLHGKDWIANLQKTERERTGISSLKVNYNRVFGYYIEISNANKEKIPDDYIRKQTLVNSERFITPDLKVYEDKILHAEEKIYDLESQLFN